MNRFTQLCTTSLTRRFFSALLLACTLLITPFAHAQELQAIPPLSSLVVDQTGTLSATEQATLDAKLKAFETSKGSQIAVLMVNSTAPEDMFSYAQRAAESYKIGRANVGDGVLIVVAKNDRKMWIYPMRALACSPSSDRRCGRARPKWLQSTNHCCSPPQGLCRPSTRASRGFLFSDGGCGFRGRWASSRPILCLSPLRRLRHC